MQLPTTPIAEGDFLRSLIPQKAPFVMVDTLYHFSETDLTSGFTVLDTNLFSVDNKLSAPGLIENMAQTVALHTGYRYYLEQKEAPVGYIGAIKKATIFTLPKVGSEMFTTVEILHDIMGITLVAAKIMCENELLAQSEMKTALAS